MWWQRNIEYHERYELDSGDAIRLNSLIGREWPKYYVLRLLQADGESTIHSLANEEASEEPEPELEERVHDNLSTIEEGQAEH